MTEHITIGDISPRIQYTADGVQTVFTYPFPIFEDSDLEIYLDDTLQASGFTVAGAGESDGGNVTFASAPANGVTVTLRRRITVARTSDFQEGGAFRAKTINDELDRLIAVAQEIRDDLDRTLQLAPTDPDAALELPEAADRVGKYLAFDEGGTPIAAAPPTDGTAVSAYMATVLDDADAGAARTTLELGTAAVLDTGTSANNAVQLDGSAKLPSVDGSQLTNLPPATDATARQMATLNAFRLAAYGAISVQNYDDGFVDEFEDETGVDAGSATLIPQGDGTAIGNLTSNGGLAAAFDGNNYQTYTACAGTGSAGEAQIGKDYGAGINKTVVRFKVWSPNDQGWTTSHNSGTMSFQLQGSTDNLTWADVGIAAIDDEGATGWRSLDHTVPNATAYRYWRVAINREDGAGNPCVGELEFYEAGAGGSSGHSYDRAKNSYDGTLEDAYSQLVLLTDGTGYQSYTLCTVIGAAEFTKTGLTKVAVTFEAGGSQPMSVDGAVIAEQAASGDAYDMNPAKKAALTFDGGAAGFSILAGETIKSDFADLSLNPTKALVIKFYMTSAGGPFGVKHRNSSVANWQGYAKASSDTHNVDDDTGFSAQWDSIGVRYIHAKSAADLTLISQPVTADATPSDASITLFTEDIDSVTLNTDIKAWASRDGGTTFTQITLTNDFSISHEGAMLNVLVGSADISGQPSSTSMVWKITTHNTKEVRAHGVSLAWS